MYDKKNNDLNLICQLQILLDVGQDSTTVCAVSRYSITIQTGPEVVARLTQHRSGKTHHERGDQSILKQRITQKPLQCIIYCVLLLICISPHAVIMPGMCQSQWHQRIRGFGAVPRPQFSRSHLTALQSGETSHCYLRLWPHSLSAPTGVYVCDSDLTVLVLAIFGKTAFKVSVGETKYGTVIFLG